VFPIESLELAELPAVRGVRAAFVFLTRLPLGGFPYSAADWRWASAYFPLVGGIIGCLMLGVWYAAARVGALPAAVLVVFSAVLVTGALHEDGLADSADALGGGGDRQRILAILKDSRIGAYGALALGLCLLLRVSLLASVLPTRPLVIVPVMVLSRLPCVWLLATLEYVTPEAQARNSVFARSGWLQVALATGFCALLLAAMIALSAVTWKLALLLGLASSGVGLAAASYYRARLGGVTGDLLGATVPVCECVLLLAIAFAVLPKGVA
jgi:adenosylcobinamide-GDP ribazoletransferase